MPETNSQKPIASPKITVYTDGSSRGNPGPGGYGIVLQYGKHRKELSKGYKLTTNNRMELLAVIVALEVLKVADCKVTVYTDSKYVADSIEKGWVFSWERKRFKGKKNADLWIRFLKIYKKHQVRLIWVKGHANNPGNERCDKLAVDAALSNNLEEDTGYLEELKNGESGFELT